MQRVRPKKALGQHFLTDHSIAERIAGTLDEYTDLPIVEIGPGMGVLSVPLLNRHPADKVTLVEIDKESVEWLKNNLPAPQPRIIEGDFLTMDSTELVPGAGEFCVIGNYPYNISSQIFFRILDWRDRVISCSGMLQREVAQRLTAAEGSRDRGILSVLLQAWYTPEYLFTVSEHVFNPPPKVKSGVIRLTRNKRQSLGVDEILFRTVVKTAFGQRRKMLRGSLKGLLPKNAQDAIGADMEQLRPEQLSVEQFIELTRRIADARKSQNT